MALIPRVDRDAKLDAVAVLGLFLGYDATVTGGVRMALLKLNQGMLKIDKVAVTTAVRTKDEEFPLSEAKRPTDDELQTIETELKSGLPEPECQAGPGPEAAKDEIDAEVG